MGRFLQPVELVGGPADGEVIDDSDKTLLFITDKRDRFLYLDKATRLDDGDYQAPYYELNYSTGKYVFKAYWVTTKEEWERNSDITKGIVS